MTRMGKFEYSNLGFELANAGECRLPKKHRLRATPASIIPTSCPPPQSTNSQKPNFDNNQRLKERKIMSSKPTPTTPIAIGRKRSASESSVDSNDPGLSPGSAMSQSPPQVSTRFPLRSVNSHRLILTDKEIRTVPGSPKQGDPVFPDSLVFLQQRRCSQVPQCSATGPSPAPDGRAR